LAAPYGPRGDAARHLASADPTRSLNLRGVYWRVLEAGEVELGAEVSVLSR
jgi:MOSC domain-containing protein YiiM